MHLIATIGLITLFTDLLVADLTVPVIAAVQIVVEVSELFTRSTRTQIGGVLGNNITARAEGAPHPLLHLFL